ncbi:MAG: family 43 glycosylhydrolase [Oscillospiraceae bacterium]|nr:family 43 glycosylhydrolase [Oscillospiraceae bacterium]
MKRQVYNPFLPLSEYIPDGEPHVFGDRVYLYGSHDKEGGETFCMLDYTVWSALVNDLTDWRCEGISYRAEQDPAYPERPYMYAPDVVRGNDGRYYLYYCMSGDKGQGGYHGPISAAVGDSPAGPFSYLGFVRNQDGSPMLKYVPFDPGVINDDGVIRLYYGTQYDYEERSGFNEKLLNEEVNMFGKTADEITGTKESVMGANMLVLDEDMLTVKEGPVRIIPYRVRNTGFEAHPFFEGSSIRKIGNLYYFIYSSQQNDELCYAVSRHPDRGFRFGGVIINTGDVGLEGRNRHERLNLTGTTHGSIEQINGKWYVFYHRLTHRSDYSRQACAEEIRILPNGSIPQVEVTSCGLNGGALLAEGSYPAAIACNITNGMMPHCSNGIFPAPLPAVTHTETDGETERYIENITERSLIGFKYFQFKGDEKLTVTYRSNARGHFFVLDEETGSVGKLVIKKTDTWAEASCRLDFSAGVHPLYLVSMVPGNAELLSLRFS